MDYFDYSGGIDGEQIDLPSLDSFDDLPLYYVLDDGVAYDAETGTPFAFDDTNEFESYADGFIFGVDDMDMDFEADALPPDSFDDGWSVEMLGDANVSIDPLTGDTWMQDLNGDWLPVAFDDYGNLTTLIDDSGIVFDAQMPNVTVVDGPDGQYMVIAKGDGSVNITDPTGGNFTAQANSPLVTGAVANTPGVKLPSTPTGTIDNFFALAASLVQTFAQYKTAQNTQAVGAYRNTTGSYTVGANGQIVRTNAQGVPIRTAAASGSMSQTTMLLIGAAVVGVILLTRKG